MDEQTSEILIEATKQVAKEAYNDAAKPAAKSTGELVGLVPRAIKAALLPLEKWITKQEYNLEETKKLLEIKLEKINPELIDTPEPYIAVPALQYISYCMDSEELRDMYANLLANSMNNVTKNQVHPGFVDIIRQLSPDEAKVLKEISTKKEIPIIGVRYNEENGGGIDVVEKFSNIGEIVNCERKYDIEKYLDNLERLGILFSTTDKHYTDKSIYEDLKNHQEIKRIENIPEKIKEKGFTKVKITEGISKLTSFGESFCKICVTDKE